MSLAPPLSTIQVETRQGDIRTIQRDRTWAQFKHLQQGFEQTRGLRLFYYNGTIEILMPGEAHELFKSLIGFLVETFLFHHGIEFKPTGSMTLEREGIAAAEADESYDIDGWKLVIEVNFTHGNTSKLERYQAFGVHEVWFWEDGLLTAYHLRSDGPVRVTQSEIPDFQFLDLHVLADCILLGETSRIQAAQQLLAAHSAP
jgi:Uma2 family endonuclease